jgi:very-short-patch-repair endonuclease
MKLCECGCGKEVKNLSSRFLLGHNSRTKETLEKRIITSRLHYNTDNPMYSDIVKNKMRDSFKKKTGFDWVNKSDQEKQNLVQKWSEKTPDKMILKEIKKQKTCFDKYGKKHAIQTNEIQEKVKNTTLKNFGVECAFQSEKVKEQCKQQHIINYGTENVSQSELIKNRKKETYTRNFGVDHWSKTPQARILHRINRLKMIENQLSNGEPLCPYIGNTERIFLDILQQHTKYNIIRNDPSFRYIIGRFPDGHIPELKLFIQFDEHQHFINKEMIIYKEDDIQCTKDLESIPGYKVFRVSEKQWKENQNQVINSFKSLTNELQKGL